MDEMDTIADSYKHTLRSLGYRHNRKTSTWDPPSQAHELQFKSNSRRPQLEDNIKASSSTDSDSDHLDRGWKQAKSKSSKVSSRRDEPAFPSMSNVIKATSSKQRQPANRHYLDDRSDKPTAEEESEDEPPLLPVPRSKVVQVAEKRPVQSLQAHSSRQQSSDSDSEVPARQLGAPTSTASLEVSSDASLDRRGGRPDLKRRNAERLRNLDEPKRDDFDQNRTLEIVEKARHSGKGSSIAPMPASFMGGEVREIKPVQVRSQPASLERSGDEDDMDAMLAQKIAQNKRSMPEESKASATMRSSVNAPSTGAISVDSLMARSLPDSDPYEEKTMYSDEGKEQENRRRLQEEKAAYRVEDTPRLQQQQHRESPSTASGKSSLASTYPLARPTAAESKRDDVATALNKSSSGVFHEMAQSDSQLEMESFEESSLLMHHIPMPAQQPQKVPYSQHYHTPTGRTKNELYLEDSEDAFERPSPGIFSRGDSVFSRSVSTNRDFPSSHGDVMVRMDDERNVDPFDDPDDVSVQRKSQSQQQNRLQLLPQDDEGEEYSQDFASPSAMMSPLRGIDTSKSVVIDLNIDTSEAVTTPHSGKYGRLRTPGSTNSISGPPSLNYPSNRSSPGFVNQGTLGSFSRQNTLQLQQTQQQHQADDDAVLMGTTRFTPVSYQSSGGEGTMSGRSNTFSDTNPSNRSGTDQIERDSLGGTFDRTTDNREEEGMSPLGFDVKLSTADSIDRDSASQIQSKQQQPSQSVSQSHQQYNDFDGISGFSGISSNADITGGGGGEDSLLVGVAAALSRRNLPTSHSDADGTEIHSVNLDDTADRFDDTLDIGPLSWNVGRAPLDQLELAEALEVHISGLKVNAGVFRTGEEVASFHLVADFACSLCCVFFYFSVGLLGDLLLGN